MATPNWNWQDDAACRGEDLVLFFGKPGEKAPARLVREQKATIICAGCPVLTKCLMVAFEGNEKTGVWGGLGEDERSSKRRAWQRSTAYERRIETAEAKAAAAKHCAGCGVTKPAGQFPKDRRQVDGLNRVCKACASKAGKAIRDRQRVTKAVA